MAGKAHGGSRGDLRAEIVLIEPASSLSPSERREQWDVLLEYEGLAVGTRVTRLTAFTLGQLAERPLARPWRVLHSRSHPGQQLVPMVRLGPRLVSWPLLLAQVLAAGAVWRFRQTSTSRAAALALTPQAALLCLPFARLAGVRLVVRLQADLPGEELRSTRITRRILTSVLRRADRVVAISQFTSDVARRAGVRDSAIRILPPPIDPVFERRTRLRRDPAGFRLGFVGRLEPEKGCADVLRAFARGHEASWSLVIAGRGSEEERLRRLSAQIDISDRVEWLGFVGRACLSRVLETLHCLAVPTRIEEGFGRVAVEALLRGTPVVAYESHGLREACGPGAIFVPRGSIDHLTHAISRLANDPSLRNELSLLGRAHALRYTSPARLRLHEVLWED